MADRQEVPVLTSEMLDSMSFEDRVEYYKHSGIVEITDGLHHLVHNSNELLGLLYRMLDDEVGQSRYPILAMKDGSIWMVGHEPFNGNHAHGSILVELGKRKEDVDYSVSMEGIASSSEPPYLEVLPTENVEMFNKGKVVKVKLRTRADLPVGGASISMQGGSKELQHIFGGIDGVKIKYE